MFAIRFAGIKTLNALINKDVAIMNIKIFASIFTSRNGMDIFKISLTIKEHSIPKKIPNAENIRDCCSSNL